MKLVIAAVAAALIWIWNMKKRDEARMVLARTLYGEARGEGRTGMVAVANVIMNRTVLGGWFGSGVIGVAKKPWQFSAWNANDPNRSVIENLKPNQGNAVFDMAYEIANSAIAGNLLDVTDGATHYHADYVSPDWAESLTFTGQLGRHLFYREA